METITEVKESKKRKFDLFKTMLLIQQDVKLHKFFTEEYGDDFKKFFLLIKKNMFNKSIALYVKLMFDEYICADDNYIKMYDEIKNYVEPIEESIEEKADKPVAPALEIIEKPKAKRGRKPKVITPTEEVIVTPKKRGRKPKAVIIIEDTVIPKKRDRKPKAVVIIEETVIAPKKRGRKSKADKEIIVKPKLKRGRKSKADKEVKPQVNSQDSAKKRRIPLSEIKAMVAKRGHVTENERAMMAGYELKNIVARIHNKGKQALFTDEEARIVIATIDTVKKKLLPLLKKK